jgi:aminopeptidase N
VHGYDVEVDLREATSSETFRSTTTVRFDATTPGASTFCDLAAVTVHEATLNGKALDPRVSDDGRLELPRLDATNELRVVADFTFSRTGEGVHRFVDPADGATYTWAETALFNTSRVWAAFDQPDLRATLRLRVRVPPDWTVVSNAAGREIAPGAWTFDETPPISTYLMSFAAGPYASSADDSGDIPMALYVRRSLAEHLDADELFEISRQSMDAYHRLFGVPYPFGKYDQVFVPEFNMGAMENPGCVKFSDRFIYRSRVTDAQRQSRAIVIAHEMAHMWFGDLVTMRWWDDLWLNESFADYMSYRVVDGATRFTGAWTDFVVSRKTWGYREDQLPTTHPVVADVPDTVAALLNLDGISYAKGAGVLKQLVAWVGWGAFAAGLRQYFDRHAWGNTSLADLLDALEQSSGRDLAAWSAAWLQTAGVNVLRPSIEHDGDRYAAVSVLQTAPPDHPTLRSHHLAIGLYDATDAGLVRRQVVEVEAAGERTVVPALAGAPVADLLLLNEGDLTWAKIRLDDRSVATLRAGWLARLADPLSRALIWASVWDGVRDAELPVADYLELVMSSIEAERDTTLVTDILARAREAIDILGRPAHRAVRIAAFAARCRSLLLAADAGSDLQLAYARAFVAAVSDAADVEWVRGWLDGAVPPSGLALDPEFRWHAVRRLAALGALDVAAIDAEEARDGTSAGAEAATGARAARPAPEAKREAFERAMSPATPAAFVRAIAAGFWQADHLDLCAPYAEEYFAGLSAVWRDRPPEAAWIITSELFPWLLATDGVVEKIDDLLASDLDAGLRRLLEEGKSDLERALRARAIDEER